MTETDETLRHKGVKDDSQIIAASLRFCELTQVHDSMFDTGACRVESDDDRLPVQTSIRAIQEPLLEILTDDDLRAVTPEGIRARARAIIAAAQGGEIQQDGGDGAHAMVECLLNDLLGAGSYVRAD